MMRNIPKSAILRDIAPSGNAENLWANLLYVNNFLPFAKQYMVLVLGLSSLLYATVEKPQDS